MSFKDNKYIIVQEAISQELAFFLFNYFLLKREVCSTLIDHRIIGEKNTEWGKWNDDQVPGTYSHYGDVAMETLLPWVLPKMKKYTELDLLPTYSYARLYKNGDVLHRHKDRPSCEISTTLNLGGDNWPIYLSPYENVGIAECDGGEKGITLSSNAKGIKIELRPGDMLIYSGCVLEHWREPFEGNDCAQVFLHYNRKKENQILFDSRKHLGLPCYFRQKHDIKHDI